MRLVITTVAIVFLTVSAMAQQPYAGLQSRSITHHSSIDKGGRTLFGTIVTCIGLQAKISLPKLA